MDFDGLDESGPDAKVEPSPVRPPIAAPVLRGRPHDIDTPRGPLSDPLFWLRDDKLREGTGTNPEVLAYLAAENAYTREQLKETEALQSQLFQEMKGRINLDDQTAPVKDGDYFHYQRVSATQEFPVHCRRRGSMSAPEEVVIDENQLAAGHDHFQMGTGRISPNDRYVAYSFNFDGQDRYELRVRDLATGQDLPDSVAGISEALAWSNDSSVIFYTNPDEAQREYQVRAHRLGSNSSQDSLLFEEPDGEFEVDMSKSLSKRFLFVESESSDTKEVFYLDLNDPNALLKSLAGRVPGMRYGAVDHGDEFLIVTNIDGAENFKVVRAPIADSRTANWTELVAHDPAVKIDFIEGYRDHLVVSERSSGLPRVRIKNLVSGIEHHVTFPEPTYAVEVDSSSSPDYNSTTVRMTYESMVTPRSVYEYEMDAKKLNLLKQDSIPSGFNATLYESKRVFAPAKDGTLVPISLVYKKTTMQSDHRPLVLGGYGAYGISNDVEFNQRGNLCLLDRGVVVAVAHVRGGGEMGEGWWKAGMLMNKKNTFTDFIDCAEFLVNAGFATKGEIAIEGRSAGGLLIGAVVNMRPDLFRAAVCEVGFEDVMATMLDASIPLTELEYLEWGNPNEINAYDYMLSYSPNQNVTPQAYPHILATAGVHDPRVAYWEPAKWVQRLRAANTGASQILLHTNMGAGHVGESGRFGHLKDFVLRRAFELYHLGLRDTVPTSSMDGTRS